LTARIPDADRGFLVEEIGPLLQEAGGSRFFLTGATGFVGSWILEALTAVRDARRLPLSATVLTRDPEAFRGRLPHLANHAAVRVLSGDVRTFALPEESYDFAIHGAFDSSRQVGAAETRSTILDGTARCLELAKRAGVRRFLFVSSGAVYGRQPPEVIGSEEPSAESSGLSGNRTEYGQAKYEAERATLSAARAAGIDATVARGFAFVGPRIPLDAHFAVGNFLGDALAGRPIRVRGDGTPVRSYLYASDLAVWLLTILLRGRPGKVYNVGSEHAVTVAALARLVADVVSPGLRVDIASSPSGLPPDRYVPSTGLARAELGLVETIGLPEAIARTAAWYRGVLSAPVH
jgi:dTDP-glucose 4,6-dehydratase